MCTTVYITVYTTQCSQQCTVCYLIYIMVYSTLHNINNSVQYTSQYTQYIQGCTAIYTIFTTVYTSQYTQQCAQHSGLHTGCTVYTMVYTRHWTVFQVNVQLVFTPLYPWVASWRISEFFLIRWQNLCSTYVHIAQSTPILLYVYSADNINTVRFSTQGYDHYTQHLLVRVCQDKVSQW